MLTFHSIVLKETNSEIFLFINLVMKTKAIQPWLFIKKGFFKAVNLNIL